MYEINCMVYITSSFSDSQHNINVEYYQSVELYYNTFITTVRQYPRYNAGGHVRIVDHWLT